jgi:hypothetical protein
MNGRIDGFQVYAEYALYSDSLSLFMAQEATGGGSCASFSLSSRKSGRKSAKGSPCAIRRWCSRGSKRR